MTLTVTFTGVDVDETVRSKLIAAAEAAIVKPHLNGIAANRDFVAVSIRGNVHATTGVGVNKIVDGHHATMTFKTASGIRMTAHVYFHEPVEGLNVRAVTWMKAPAQERDDR